MTRSRALLVRHGTTPWNERGRLQGWADPPLSPTGRREAAIAAGVVAATAELGHVVSSPLERAVESAAVVAGRLDSRPVATDDRWRERSFGSLEGVLAADAFADHPELHPKSGAFSPTASLDGESARRVVKRVREAWQSLLATEYEGTPVVVTHESPLRVVTGLVDGVDPIDALRRRSFDPGTTVAVESTSSNDSGWRMLAPGSRERIEADAAARDPGDTHR